MTLLHKVFKVLKVLKVLRRSDLQVTRGTPRNSTALPTVPEPPSWACLNTTSNLAYGFRGRVGHSQALFALFI